MSVPFISINVRGLKNNVKRKAIFLFCKEEKAEIIFLQETHSQKDDETFWKTQWGDQLFFAHGTSHSAGVLVLFNRFKGNVIDHTCDPEGHWLLLLVEMYGTQYLLACVYGYNNKVLNKNFLDELSSLIRDWKLSYNIDKIIIGGDFNITPCKWMDRKPQRGLQPHLNDTLQKLCSDLNVTDVWRMANPDTFQYTWFKAGNNNICSRLDYWLVSIELCKSVIACKISVAPLTDHSEISLLLLVHNNPQTSTKVWKFNNNLLQVKEFQQQVKNMIKEIQSSDMSDLNKWEWLKFQIKQLAIITGKKLCGQTEKTN